VRAQAFQNFRGDFGATGFQHGVKGLEPFLNFYVIDAMRLGKSVVVHKSEWSFFFKE
jgi:hypothetical protein